MSRLMKSWRVLIVVPFLVMACTDPTMESLNSLNSAKKYITENNPRAAAIELKNALQADPQNAEARYELGMVNLKIGDAAGAEKEFKRALEAGWSEAAAYIGLARAMVSRRGYQELLDEIEIKDGYSATSRADLYGLKALAQAGLGKRDLANQTLKTGMDLDSSAFHVLKTTIQLALLDDNLTEADSTLKQALDKYPGNQELLLLDASSALKSKDSARANKSLQTVIDAEPANFTTYNGRIARLELASLLILEKEYERAGTTLDVMLKLFPKDPQTNYIGGMLAFAQGQYDLAEERLLKVLQVAPDHPQTMLLYGTVSFQRKNFEQAAEYLARYVDVMPDNLGARKLLGRAHMMLGQSNKASLVLKPALDTSDDVELLTLVGLNDMRGGDLGSGIANLEKAANSAPENIALRKELALAYIKSGEAELAIEELQKVLQKTDEKTSTQSLLILAHLKAGQPEDAIKNALQIVTDNPDNPAALTLAGSVFIAAGNSAEARGYFDKALKLSPDHPQASFAMAQLEEAEGNLDAATRMYKSMVDSETPSIAPMMALARLAGNTGNREDYITWLERARTKASNELQPRILLTEAYLQEGELQKADDVFKESKEIAPDSVAVRSIWSRILISNKHYNEALKVLKGLIDDEPESGYFRLLMAETYLFLGQTDDVVDQLKIVFEKDPDSLGGLALMARVALQQEDFDQAEDYSNKILSLYPKNSLGYELSGDSWAGRKEYERAKLQYREAWENRHSSGLAIKIATVAARTDDQAGIETLRSWTDGHADDIKAKQVLAALLMEQGEMQESAKIYEGILDEYPDDLSALNNLAVLYQRTQNPKAAELAEKVYRIAPENPGIQDTYGWILVQEGKLEKALGVLKSAVNALPNLAEVKYHYAAALIKSGHREEGTELLKDVLNKDTEFYGREEAEKLLVE